MAENHKTQPTDREQESLETLHRRLDGIEKKVTKINEDLRGVAAFFFLLAVMLAAKCTMPLAIAAALALTVAYVACVDYRTIKRSKRRRNKSS